MTTLVLPAKVRAVVYGILTLVGLAVGAAQVGYAAIGRGQPDWLVVALAVVPFLASGLGAVALTHTPKADSVEYVGEHRAPVYEVEVDDDLDEQFHALRRAQSGRPTEHGDGYTSGVGKRD